MACPRTLSFDKLMTKVFLNFPNPKSADKQHIGKNVRYAIRKNYLATEMYVKV